ncbi:MAG: arsenate reductase ArsC [Candidatus Saganbacteria bacterium]|nr:arsenate reductase ArsC [Candidatus Saganbacteria bacterium]
MKKKILFLCIGNCCRSQMAEGFAEKLAENKYEIYSAGSHPAGFVHPDAIAVMEEIGIDISDHYSKGVDDVPNDLDYVITMGCGDSCSLVSAKYRFDWKIEDPVGKGTRVFRQVRDEIKDKVESFFDSCKI